MKTTAKDFALFKAACEEWLDCFSLREWCIHYIHGSCEGGKAWCDANHEGRIATMGLSVDWRHIPVTPEALRKSALHECLHLVLHDLRYLVNSRVCTDIMLETVEHAAIRRLEHFIGGPNSGFAARRCGR